METAMKDLTVVIKPTRNCNLRCVYCSAGDPKARTLTITEVGTIIEKIVGRQIDSYTKFIWHGGEPLLAGLNFYRQVVEIQKPLLAGGYHIANVVQSNGTLISDEWAKFFKDHGFGVGLSIDGPRDITNKTRVFPNSQGAFEAIKRGSEILTRHEVQHGYLVVISRLNVQWIEQIIEFMHEEKKRYKLVSVSPIGRAAEAYDLIMTEGNNYSDSQILLFRYWLDQGHFTDRAALWKYIVPILTGRPIECIFFENCQLSFIGVDCNGDVYPCGRFCGSGSFKYGNLVNDSWKQVINHPSRLALLARGKHLKTCQSCEYQKICNGGCPLQGILNGGLNKPDYNCRQYQRIFSEIKERIMREI
jgi:uncharacterized protein